MRRLTMIAGGILALGFMMRRNERNRARTMNRIMNNAANTMINTMGRIGIFRMIGRTRMFRKMVRAR